MNLEDDQITNRSGNRPFNDVLTARFGRRGLIAGSLATAATTFFMSDGTAVASTSSTASGSGIGFAPIPLGAGPVPSISPDYQYQVLIPWGTPIHEGAPEFSWPPSATDQEQQIGIGHDGMWFFATGADQGLLAINHEFGRNSHVLGKDEPESLDDVRASQAAHGASVVKLVKRDGVWRVDKASHYNRRITVNTPMDIWGPLDGSSLLRNKAGNEPTGTVNNCAYGHTPWHTYLTCEENFNGYFGATGDWTPTEAQERYGFSESGFGYGWEKHDPRFDLSNEDYANEHNRFGYVVEIDPFRPDRKPAKLTALGRTKHEGAEVVVGHGGRVVVYMGDDQRFDYVYKFVSDTDWCEMMAARRHPLNHGILYVARFNDDGTGDWLPLTPAHPDLSGWSQPEICVNARLAADAVGATPMDRPEWASVDESTGDVYLTLTNNSRREVADAANPEAPNDNGHIIRFQDADGHTGTTFAWDIFILCTDTLGTDHAFTDPDGIYADGDGRLFIETDGGQPDDSNNQLLVADVRTGEIRRLFAGVADDEITGFTHTPDRRTVFINSQHPGNGDPTVTNFPAMNEVPDGETVPRDATYVITRKDGGVVGS